MAPAATVVSQVMCHACESVTVASSIQLIQLIVTSHLLCGAGHDDVYYTFCSAPTGQLRIDASCFRAVFDWVGEVQIRHSGAKDPSASRSCAMPVVHASCEHDHWAEYR